MRRAEEQLRRVLFGRRAEVFCAQRPPRERAPGAGCSAGGVRRRARCSVRPAAAARPTFEVKAQPLYILQPSTALHSSTRRPRYEGAIFEDKRAGPPLPFPTVAPTNVPTVHSLC